MDAPSQIAVTREAVLAQRDALPVFPRVIDDVLATLDDPDANVGQLVAHVARDPVLAAQVFSIANAAASHTRRDGKVRDLYTATSMIGLTRLRQTTIVTSLAGFLRGALPPGLTPGFWEHSAATGVCARQLALHVHQSSDAALIAGLLHDIGQLWLFRFHPEAFMAAWQTAACGEAPIETAERERFGVDHSTIGAWLAESWDLPAPVCAAIRHHHAPDSALHEPLVAVVHVAEVLSNALDLGGSDPRVGYLSDAACEQLGLSWDESAESLFGRIDAVSHFIATYFRSQ